MVNRYTSNDPHLTAHMLSRSEDQSNNCCTNRPPLSMFANQPEMGTVEELICSRASDAGLLHASAVWGTKGAESSIAWQASAVWATGRLAEGFLGQPLTWGPDRGDSVVWGETATQGFSVIWVETAATASSITWGESTITAASTSLDETDINGE